MMHISLGTFGYVTVYSYYSCSIVCGTHRVCTTGITEWAGGPKHSELKNTCDILLSKYRPLSKRICSTVQVIIC